MLSYRSTIQTRTKKFQPLMIMATPLLLTGCAPVPLAHYLKALGVVRLLSAADPATQLRGAWTDAGFALHTELSAGEVEDYFLHHYRPTPVFAPWNGGSGFYPGDNQAAIRALEGGTSDRFSAYRQVVAQGRAIVARLGLKEKPDGSTKETLLNICRNSLPDCALEWLDAVLVLGHDGPKYPPLLGTGGNDGRLDFTNNFMQRLADICDFKSGQPTERSRHWLRASLFGSLAAGSSAKASVGQFFPGAAGGANGTSGFDAPSAINPWDFVLMIEGALLFAAASVKKLESSAEGTLVYPFCVRQSGAGYASASAADEPDARCEMWMPLWQNPVTLAELSAILSEGRAQVGSRTARHGVDFARAVVTLGVDRGIAAFQRYGFQVRNGLAYFATPLDRIPVRRNAKADLLADIDGWYDRLRHKAGTNANPSPPASVAQALHGIESAIFEFCRHGTDDALLNVLIALGAAERALAGSFAWTTKDTNRIPPLGGLRPQWLEALPADKVEFRLACSLAGTRTWVEASRASHWLRQHLEPVSMSGNATAIRARWLDQLGNDVAWHDGLLNSALNDVIHRRLLWLDRHRAGCWLDRSPRPASLGDVAEFIEGRTDDKLLTDLLWGLSLLDWQAVSAENRADTSGMFRYDWRKDDYHKAVPSAFYALLKLCHRRESGTFPAIPLTPAIHRLAAAGRGLEASQAAVRRLRGSGCAPLVWELPVQAHTARRTAAALLFPLSPCDLRLLEQYALSEPQTSSQT
jgi:CRISPR-associated protein Csx17